jgi:hypothetical protein
MHNHRVLQSIRDDGVAAQYPKIANTATAAGKIAWSGLIGAGQGAVIGAGSTRDDRMGAAKTMSLFGGGAGLLGGAFGVGIQSGINKWLAGSAAKQAAQRMAPEYGLNAGEALKNQLPEYSESVSHVVPNTGDTTESLGHMMTQRGLDLLHKAGSYDAGLSSDGVKSIYIDVLHDLTANKNNVDLARNLGTMSPVGEKALSVIDNLANLAQHSPDGRVSLTQVAEYQREFNRLYSQGGKGDSWYSAISGGLNKWLQSNVNRAMFVGDDRAWQDYQNYLKLYGAGAKMLDGKSAFGQMIDHALPARDVANWITGTGKAKQVPAALDLIGILQNTIGPNSPEMDAVRSMMWNKIAAPNNANSQQIADIINNYVNTPIAKKLFNEDQVNSAVGLASVLKQMPRAEGHGVWDQLKHFIGGHGSNMGIGAAGLYGTYEGFTEKPHAGIWERLGDAVLKGTKFAGMAAGVRYGVPLFALAKT